ncbi:hypothetical protein JTE90_007931 [Oedothorax gibbosus]|uniref:Uncharacterized protein n=1 Tax=Oedothorax gibbosus TaxID=931172 RepID=A0AAV6VHP6_9ARAC|nr:hypothetical protein JTE90_007931 [Oedothorax gibbosus]
MAHYGIYGTLQPSGGTACTSHGLSSSQNNKTLHTRSTHSNRSPSKSTTQYLSPYSTSAWTRQRSPSPNRFNVDGTRDQSCDLSQLKVKPSSHSPSYFDYRDQSCDTSRYTVNQRSKSPSSYDYYSEKSPTGKSKDFSRSTDHYKVRGVLNTRNTVWTDLSLRYTKSPKYKTDSFASKSTKRSDGSFSKLYDHPSRLSADSSGWRERLAQQGYVAATAKRSAKRAPERKWHYLDEGEQDESNDEFTHRTSQGCNVETDGQQLHESVISRTKRMRLQKITDAVECVDVSIQVDVEELANYRHQQEVRSRRSFISSRHHSWYDTTSYSKYLSPMPWRGTTAYSGSRYATQRNTTDSPRPPSSPEDNKDFRKSVLNVDLPQTEARAFAERQAETRRTVSSEDGATSEDGSPSETGYDSSCTDADRSSEGFLTDSLDRSPSFRLGSSYKSSQRSTPYGDSLLDDGSESKVGDFESNFRDAMRDIVLENNVVRRQSDFFKDVVEYGSEEPGSLEDSFEGCRPRSDSSGQDFAGVFSDESQVDLGVEAREKHSLAESSSQDELYAQSPSTGKQADFSPKCLESLCFRFKSLAEGSSQRDSGFSEILINSCDSPCLNVESEPCLNSEFHPEPCSVEELANNSKSQHGFFFGPCRDIDLLLLDDKDFVRSSFDTFEDFERVVENHKSNVRRSVVEKWSKPAKVGLKLDLEACDRFIGVCHDIDEMLGMPAPLTPEDPVASPAKNRDFEQEWMSAIAKGSVDEDKVSQTKST